MPGIVIDKLLFTMTSRLIVVRRTDRKELPHLTISLKNASGEIDLHLKDESAPVGTDPYTPLLRLSKEELSEFEHQFSSNCTREFPKLYSIARRMRPGWLARKGYFVGLIDNEGVRADLYESAPRIRGKRRVDGEKLKRLFTDVDSSKISLYHPSALHSDEFRSLKDPVFAVRASGHHRMIALFYGPWKTGNRTWILLNPLVAAAQDVFSRSLPTSIKYTMKSVWDKVYDALQLNELGIERG